MHDHLDRNLVGYGAHPPDPQWPGEARIAVSFVLNYEEGGENTILNGDPASEVFLCETPGGTPIQGGRDLSIESQFEYGSRAGFWRILRLFAERDMRFTSWAVGRALELNPAAGKAMADGGHEVASHGWRWINYKDFTLEQELDHIKKTVAAIKTPPASRRSAGTPAASACTPCRPSSSMAASSIRAIPTTTTCPTGCGSTARRTSIIPYTLEVNDMKFGVAPGYTAGDGWLQAMKDSFDVLYAEGARSPKMMSIGLHCRLVRPAEPGRDPGALHGLRRLQAQGLGRHARGDRAALDEGAARHELTSARRAHRLAVVAQPDIDRRDHQHGQRVEEARPNTSEMARPWKIGSA